MWLVLCLLQLPSITAAPSDDATVTVSGELRCWHKVTLTLDGPFAHEMDTEPNPFLDYRGLRSLVPAPSRAGWSR